VLDDTVFAARVHALDDHQQRVRILRIQPVLQLDEPRDITLQPGIRVFPW
jgi:hypothetical protein